MGLLADVVDALAIEVTACQRLLYVGWLTCLHGHDGVGSV